MRRYRLPAFDGAEGFLQVSSSALLSHQNMHPGMIELGPNLENGVGIQVSNQKLSMFHIRLEHHKSMLLSIELASCASAQLCGQDVREKNQFHRSGPKHST